LLGVGFVHLWFICIYIFGFIGIFAILEVFWGVGFSRRYLGFFFRVFLWDAVLFLLWCLLCFLALELYRYVSLWVFRGPSRGPSRFWR